MGVTMRLFYGIKFSKTSNEKLGLLQEYVIQKSLKGKFTDCDNFHLTLCFLGEVEADQLPVLKKILDVVIAKNELPLIAKGCYIDRFQKKNKDIIWVGIEDNASIISLEAELRQNLYNHQLKIEDQPYIPHITLGRQIILNSNGISQDNGIFGALGSPIELVIEAVCLYESKRVEGRLIYEPIYCHK